MVRLGVNPECQGIGKTEGRDDPQCPAAGCSGGIQPELDREKLDRFGFGILLSLLRTNGLHVFEAENGCRNIAGVEP